MYIAPKRSNCLKVQEHWHTWPVVGCLGWPWGAFESHWVTHISTITGRTVFSLWVIVMGWKGHDLYPETHRETHIEIGVFWMVSAQTQSFRLLSSRVLPKYDEITVRNHPDPDSSLSFTKHLYLCVSWHWECITKQTHELTHIHDEAFENTQQSRHIDSHTNMMKPLSDTH